MDRMNFAEKLGISSANCKAVLIWLACMSQSSVQMPSYRCLMQCGIPYGTLAVTPEPHGSSVDPRLYMWPLRYSWWFLKTWTIEPSYGFLYEESSLPVLHRRLLSQVNQEVLDTSKNKQQLTMAFWITFWFSFRYLKWKHSDVNSPYFPIFYKIRMNILMQTAALQTSILVLRCLHMDIKCYLRWYSSWTLPASPEA